MTSEVETVDNKERHVTTIAGPQAEALLSVLDGHHVLSWTDKSVEGLTVAELWVDVTHAEELAGTYNNN